MSSLDKDPKGALTNDELGLWALWLIGVPAGTVYGLWWAGLSMEGADTTGLLPRIVRGDVAWPHTATVLALALAASLCLVAAGWGWWFVRVHAKEDAAAKYLATPYQLRALRKHGRLTAHARFNRKTPGISMGRTVAGWRTLYAGLEDIITVIVGPRMNKTTGFAIPFVVEAQGPVVATSNKRDLVDRTRDVRAKLGAVWVFDPQAIIGETARFFWDPLSFVRNGDSELMDARAAQLTHRFAFATGTHHTGPKDYFDTSGEALMGQLILAAACAHESILTVRAWVSNPNDTRPAQILAEHGFPMASQKLRTTMGLTYKQRDGIYGTADTMTQFLTYRSVQAWVTPGNGRVEFDPFAFATSTDALYLISREGVTSMGPLVTALTAAVCDAAERVGERSAGGRLPVEMRLVLDEVANICRWDDLPNLITHYGSRGILIISFLQNWNQGKELWGDNGMGKLWSSSTMRVVGGGLAENGFLGSVREMIGTYKRVTRTTSTAGGKVSVSTSTHDDDVLSVRDLTAMSGRRYVLFTSGHRPVLMRVYQSWRRPYRKALSASARAHDPSRAPVVPPAVVKPSTGPLVASQTPPRPRRASVWADREDAS